MDDLGAAFFLFLVIGGFALAIVPSVILPIWRAGELDREEARARRAQEKTLRRARRDWDVGGVIGMMIGWAVLGVSFYILVGGIGLVPTLLLALIFQGGCRCRV